MNDIWFMNPWLLILFFPAIIFFILLLVKKVSPAFFWPILRIAPKEGRKIPLFGAVRTVVFFLSLAVVIFVVAGIFRGEKILKEVQEAYTIILVQDRSGSMAGLFDSLSKVSEAFMGLRNKDKFCGVYFSDTAVRTACGESAKTIAYITNEDLDRALSSGSTSIGGGTEPGAGLLKALEIILDEAEIFSKNERDEILLNLVSKKMPVIPENKINSHKGFLVILESDALFPTTPAIDPVQVLKVMANLGARAYFVVFTKERAESVITAVRETGGETSFIDPALASRKDALDKELAAVFSDIDTLNPIETYRVSGVIPRKFIFEAGLILATLSFLSPLVYLLEESAYLIASRTKDGPGKDGD